MTFHYRDSQGRATTSVISREKAEELADLFEQYNLHPYRTEYGHANALESFVADAWTQIPAIAAAAADLPETWQLDVLAVLNERTRKYHNHDNNGGTL